MKTLRNFAIILALALIAACGNEEEKTYGFVVKGKVENAGELQSITLSEITPKGLILLDTSAIANDGSFEFNGKVFEKTFCTINFSKGTVVLVVDSVSEIILSVDANSPETYGVNGSPDSEQLRRLLQINNKYMLRMRSLETKYEQYTNGNTSSQEVQNQIRNDYDSIMKGRSSELMMAALEIPSGIVPYFVTNFLMPEADYDFFDKVDKKYYTGTSLSKYAEEHHKRVEVLRRTAVGQTAPDIVMNDPFGKPVPLSSLRGKYVLVDFWASWCRPCREESPNMVKLYNKYKTRGFEILSVSLDDNRDAWTKAINDDRLLWTHVSDLTKWNSPTVAAYHIEAIPYTVLLNKEGKILAKNLRGEELDKKVEEAIVNGL